MKVVKNVKAEGCIEGENVHDLVLDENINDDLIKYLGQMGKLIYKKNFKKPYFKVMIRGKYTFKGAVDNNVIRVILPEDRNPEEPLDELKEFIDGKN